MGSWAWIEQVLLGGQVLRMNRLDDLPAIAAEVRGQIRSVGFRSTIQVPTHAPGGKVNGCVALSTVTREITWSDRDVQRLRLVGEAIASAIERERVENELQASEYRMPSAPFERRFPGLFHATVQRAGRAGRDGLHCS